MEGVKGIDTWRDLDFNDNFVVFRNSSAYNVSHPNRLAVEITYQVSGTNVKVLRVRNLVIPSNTLAKDSKEYGQHVKMWVDGNSRDLLDVVNVYKNASGTGYIAERFDYGNLVSNIKIVKEEEPAFATF